MRALAKLLGILLTVATCLNARAETTVESFSPQGVVKGVHQVKDGLKDLTGNAISGEHRKQRKLPRQRHQRKNRGSPHQWQTTG